MYDMHRHECKKKISEEQAEAIRADLVYTRKCYQEGTTSRSDPEIGSCTIWWYTENQEGFKSIDRLLSFDLSSLGHELTLKDIPPRPLVLRTKIKDTNPTEKIFDFSKMAEEAIFEYFNDKAKKSRSWFWFNSEKTMCVLAVPGDGDGMYLVALAFDVSGHWADKLTDTASYDYYVRDRYYADFEDIYSLTAVGEAMYYVLRDKTFCEAWERLLKDSALMSVSRGVDYGHRIGRAPFFEWDEGERDWRKIEERSSQIAFAGI